MSLLSMTCTTVANAREPTIKCATVRNTPWQQNISEDRAVKKNASSSTVAVLMLGSMCHRGLALSCWADSHESSFVVLSAGEPLE